MGERAAALARSSTVAAPGGGGGREAWAASEARSNSAWRQVRLKAVQRPSWRSGFGAWQSLGAPSSNLSPGSALAPALEHALQDPGGVGGRALAPLPSRPAASTAADATATANKLPAATLPAALAPVMPTCQPTDLPADCLLHIVRLAAAPAPGAAADGSAFLRHLLAVGGVCRRWRAATLRAPYDAAIDWAQLRLFAASVLASHARAAALRRLAVSGSPAPAAQVQGGVALSGWARLSADHQHEASQILWRQLGFHRIQAGLGRGTGEACWWQAPRQAGCLPRVRGAARPAQRCIPAAAALGS